MAIDTEQKRHAALATLGSWTAILPVPDGGGADTVDQRALLVEEYATSANVAIVSATDMVSPVSVSPLLIVTRG